MSDDVFEEVLSMYGITRALDCDYRERFDGVAYHLSAKNGATLPDLAIAFGVCETTIRQWRDLFPSFDDAIKRGRRAHDLGVVQSLSRRARGMRVKELKAFHNDGEVVTAETWKELPPDTSAAALWLRARGGEEWQDESTVKHQHEGLQVVVNVAAKGDSNTQVIARDAQPEQIETNDRKPIALNSKTAQRALTPASPPASSELNSGDLPAAAPAGDGVPETLSEGQCKKTKRE